MVSPSRLKPRERRMRRISSSGTSVPRRPLTFSGSSFTVTHESGNGQNEVDCHYAGPLKTADNVMMFKQIVRAVAMRSGIHASFLPKPLADQAGSGLLTGFSWLYDTFLC